MASQQSVKKESKGLLGSPLRRIGALASMALAAAGAYLFYPTTVETLSSTAPTNIATSFERFEVAFMSKLFEQNCLQKQQLEWLQQEVDLLQRQLSPAALAKEPKWTLLQQKVQSNRQTLVHLYPDLGVPGNFRSFDKYLWQQFKEQYQNSCMENTPPQQLSLDLLQIEKYQEHLQNQLVQKQEKKRQFKQLYHETEQQLTQQQHYFASLQAKHEQQTQAYQSLNKQQQLLRQELKHLQQRTGIFGPIVSQDQDHLPVQRIHILSSGESLSSLARYYYGNADRWQEIYEANRTIIADVNQLKVGATLVIP